MGPTDNEIVRHHPPPPKDLNNRQLPLINSSELKLELLYRVHQTLYDPIYFGKKAVYRFDDPRQEYGILYAGNDQFCAFRETIFPSTTTGPYINYKSVTKVELKKRCLSLITLSRPLNFVDLTGAGLTHIDADGRLATEENYPLSQQWSRAFWEHPSQPDGLYYRSRYDPSRFCFALFDRLETVLSVTETINFLQSSFRANLAEILKTYQYGLID